MIYRIIMFSSLVVLATLSTMTFDLTISNGFMIQNQYIFWLVGTFVFTVTVYLSRNKIINQNII